MSIIRDTVVLEKGYRATFVKAFTTAENPSDVMDLIMETKSTSNKEKYGWLGDVSEMKEWIDERTLKGVKDYEYEIPNKKYESTLKVHEDEIDDDQLGNVKIRINDLAKKAKVFVRKLFFDALLVGISELAYDGQYFFDTDHDEDPAGNQSNLLTYTKAGTLPTVAELKTAFEAAESAMLLFTNDQAYLINEGTELNLKVICHPDLKSRFRELFNSQLISNTTNVLKDAAKLVVSGRVTTNTDWYLFDTSGGMKPFIWQKRKDVTFDALEGKSERGFMRGEYLYGIKARYGFGYGLWQKAIKNKV